MAGCLGFFGSSRRPLSSPAAWSILKIAKRSCENVTGPQEEINFSVKLKRLFLYVVMQNHSIALRTLMPNTAPVGIDCALISVATGPS